MESRQDSYFQTLFSLDVRSLALFRIGLGLLILADLFFRVGDLTMFYTDSGVLPRAFLLEMNPRNDIILSPHLWGGSALVEGGLFLIAAIFAISLLIGFHSTIVTIASWLLLISLHERNFLVLQGGDVLFRLMLFWGIFLPLGAYASLDRWRKKRPSLHSDRMISIGTAAYILQLCLIYWSAIYFKWNNDWLGGKAVTFALHIDQFITPIGLWVREMQALHPILTYFTLFIEGIVPLFLFIPRWQGPIRTLVVLLFFSLHLSFAFTMTLGLFPWICIVAWTPLIPTWFWEQFTKVSHASPFSYASKLENGIVAIILLSICFTNWSSTHPKWKAPEMARPFYKIAAILHLQQKWNMFSMPLRQDGWYVIEGRLKNGTSVDLFRKGAPIDWEKPELPSSLYPTQRWRKYMMNLWFKRSSSYRKPFTAYLCQEWNKTHSGLEQLHTIRMYYMLEKTGENFEIRTPKKVLLQTHECFKVPSQ